MSGINPITTAGAYWKSLATGENVSPDEIGAGDAIAYTIGTGLVLPFMILGLSGCGSVSESGFCNEAPSIDGYAKSEEETVEYSDTETTYVISGITECGQPVAEDAIQVTMPEEDGVISSTAYDAETGDLTVAMQLFHPPMSGHLNLRILGSNDTKTVELWYPDQRGVEIVQEQANAGEPAAFYLNEEIAGAENFEWRLDGVQIGSEEFYSTDSFVYDFGDLGSMPALADLELSFDTWYGEHIAINQTLEIYPNEEDICTASPIYESYNIDPEEIVEYSNTGVTYIVSGISDCDVAPAASAITLSMAETDGEITSASYNEAIGEYAATVNFYHPTGGGHLNLTIAGTNATEVVALWYPDIEDVYIVQEQVEAESQVTINLNEIPAGASDIRWYVDGVEISQSDSLVFTFSDPGQAWPQISEVAVTFYPSYVDPATEDPVTISQDIEVYPAN